MDDRWGHGLLPAPDHFSVKMPVFSFAKLGQVDAILGPEMKSTGEVMGIDHDFSSALYKALIAGGFRVPAGGKILATIGNARATVRLQASGGSLAALCWGFEPRQASIPVTTDDLAASTDESTALSRALRQLGFRFVGPTTVHAAMQSLGMVNDHLADCSIRAAVEAERNRFSRPAAARPRPGSARKAAGDG